MAHSAGSLSYLVDRNFLIWWILNCGLQGLVHILCWSSELLTILLGRCDGNIFRLFGNDCLHLCQGLVQPCFFKLHLQVVDSAHFESCYESTCAPLYRDRSLQDELFDVRPLGGQHLYLILHHARILPKFHFSSKLVLLQLGQKLALLSDRA